MYLYNVVGICDKPVAPANGGVIITDITEGGTVTFFCYRGYILYGYSSITCQPDGEWSGAQPKCIRMFECIMLTC